MDWNVIIPALTGLLGTAIGAYFVHLARMREERRKDMLAASEVARIDENQKATLYEISDDTIRNRFAWLEGRVENYEKTIDGLEQEKATLIEEKETLLEELQKTRRSLDEASFELQRTRRERDEATKARQDRLDYIQDLEKKLEHANAEIIRLTAEADEMRARLEKLEKRDTGPLRDGSGQKTGSGN